MSLRRAVYTILDWASTGKPSGYACLTAAHSLMTCREDPQARMAFKASRANFTDGMSLVWYSRWKGVPQAERIYAGDLIPAIAQRSADRGLTHYFYGGAPGIPEMLADRLKAQFTGFEVAGTWSPPFRAPTAEEDRADMDRINSAQPDIVWVGLGSGKQETWMAEHRQRLNAPLMISIGAAFDYLSGSKPWAPRWIQRSGFEWAFRLVTEPRRLWRRYFSYPHFVLLVFLQELGLLSHKAGDQADEQD